METPQLLSAASLNPVPATSDLKLQFVGQQLDDVQPPAAIVDAASGYDLRTQLGACEVQSSELARKVFLRREQRVQTRSYRRLSLRQLFQATPNFLHGRGIIDV